MIIFRQKIIQLNSKEHSLTLVAKNVTVGQKIVWNWNEKKQKDCLEQFAKKLSKTTICKIFITLSEMMIEN